MPAKEIVAAKYPLAFADKGITLPLILSTVIDLYKELLGHIDSQAILGQPEITELNRSFREEFCR